MPEDFGNDWGKSVAGVVIRDGKVLLVRHTYGAGTAYQFLVQGYVNGKWSSFDSSDSFVSNSS